MTLARLALPALLLALALAPAPARAQLPTVVVPQGQGVVVPPRGALPGGIQPGTSASPRMALRRPERPAAPAPQPGGEALDAGISPAATALALVPLALAAALASVLPGGGGGASGPARTR